MLAVLFLLVQYDGAQFYAGTILWSGQGLDFNKQFDLASTEEGICGRSASIGAGFRRCGPTSIRPLLNLRVATLNPKLPTLSVWAVPDDLSRSSMDTVTLAQGNAKTKNWSRVVA